MQIHSEDFFSLNLTRLSYFPFVNPLTVIVIKNNRSVCYLLYIFDQVGFLILVNESIRSSVYLSDNVLLPGLVQYQFESEFISKELLAGNKEEKRRTPEKILMFGLLQSFSN